MAKVLVDVVNGDHHHRARSVHPGRRAEDTGDGAARAVLARVSYADDEAVELVGQPVQRRDGVTHLGVRVGVRVADVVGDGVDDDQHEVLEPAGEPAQRGDVLGQLHVLLHDVDAVHVGVGRRRPRREIDLRAVLGGDEQHREPLTAEPS